MGILNICDIKYHGIWQSLVEVSARQSVSPMIEVVEEAWLASVDAKRTLRWPSFTLSASLTPC